METIIKNILKGLGITPDMIENRMAEFVSTVKHYDAQMSEMNRRIGVMEENISAVMRAMNIDTSENRRDIATVHDAEIVPLSKRKANEHE